MKKIEILPEFTLKGNYELPNLPYTYDALEPVVDARTMEIHHTKHHQAYIDNLNKALTGHEAANEPLLHLFAKISQLPAAVRNNGGGHYNHSLFWTVMQKPQGDNNKPYGNLMVAIDKDLGGYDKFAEMFTQAALTRFGSGWAWLSVDEDGKLFVSSTPNQDNPLMDVAEHQGYPVLGIDVWEHAYYLNYQNRRPDYVKAFLNIINWDEVAARYESIIK
jgi:superoxide dismutase, Fe-Mn family